MTAGHKEKFVLKFCHAPLVLSYSLLLICSFIRSPWLSFSRQRTGEEDEKEEKQRKCMGTETRKYGPRNAITGMRQWPHTDHCFYPLTPSILVPATRAFFRYHQRISVTCKFHFIIQNKAKVYRYL